MGTYIMLGKYSESAIEGISAERTAKCSALIQKFDGEIISMYAMLGKYDLLFIVQFPDTDQAMKASVALSKATHISFVTSPAVSVDAFDEMMADQ